MTVLASAIVASSAAHADAYVGVGLGYTNIDGSDSGISFDGSDWGYKLFGGYRFNEYFGLELAYYDYGEPDDNFLGLDVDIEADGFGGFAVGFFPVTDKLDLIGKIGYVSYDIKAKAAGISVSDDDEDFAWGLGGDYRLNDQFSISVEWERLEASDADADMISLSGRYHF